VKNILVPAGDDGGVFLLSEDIAIVETVDVITPVVNDPFLFGVIASTNSLSDIYAMGGVPKTSLCIMGFSSCDTEVEIVREILKGALDVFNKESVVLIGGHTFEDKELKVGFSITGIIDKNHILRTEGARPGDLIVLTKPIGTGILTTALKGRKIKDEDLDEAIKWMRLSNKKASEAALKAGATACTDVTGFGLLGHALNMVKAGGIKITIEADKVPLMDGVIELTEKGMVPEGAYNNLKYLEGKVFFAENIPESKRLILSDPQTSGGLLIALREEKIEVLLENNVYFTVIGSVKEGDGRIEVV
jgi:selenide,water dikinase